MSRHATRTALHGRIDEAMLRPMLAETAAEPFDDPAWLFEQKWDGYRAIGVTSRVSARLLSRNGNSLADRFPSVAEALSAIPHKAVIDGEVIARDIHGRISFQLLQNAQTTPAHDLSYCLFDILFLDGQDLRALPLRERKYILQDAVPFGETLKYTDHLVAQGNKAFGFAVRDGLEGVMAKRTESPYLSGRRTDLWLKIKTHHRQEAVICGFTEPRGSREDLGALILGVYQNNRLCYIGHTGTGFTRKELGSLRRRLLAFRQPAPPFATPPKTNGPVTWVRPELVCEVKFTEWTADGTMRHPVFLGLRDDKSPRGVRREDARPHRRRRPVLPPAVADIGPQRVAVGGHELTLSHPDKILWPDEGITKADLVRYYHTVARYLLPHVNNRPHSLRRRPDGIDGPEFFQKNVTGHLPEWVQTYSARSLTRGRPIRYLLCQNAATLLYMVNLGCIEIHPWLSRVQSPDRPDYCVIDLDPQDVDFAAVVETARACHSVLSHIGVPSYPKTSGGRGMHIYIPLGARYDYDVSRRFAQLIAQVVHERMPKVTSLERLPHKRRRRVYIDYLQNGQGKTMASPYSVRAVPGAQVSAPLQWSEVNARLHPGRFTIATVPKRLASIGDLFKPATAKPLRLEEAVDRLLG